MARFSLGISALMVLLAAAPASAQLCGVTLVCEWPLPDVGYWGFDDGAGGVAVDPVNGNDAIWRGSEGDNVWTNGLIGAGSQHNDENGGNGQEHFEIPSMPQLSGADGLTIAMWFNMNVDSNNNSTYNGLFMTRTLVSSFGGGDENWGIALENNDSPRHLDWRIDGAPGPEIDNIEGNVQDRWFHAVFTWDGTDQGDGFGERALFLDGVELFREDAPIGTIVQSGSFQIGNDPCCHSREFTGTVDEAAVWSFPLTADEVHDLHHGNLFGTPTYPGWTFPNPPPLPDNIGEIINDNFFQPALLPEQGDLTGDGVVDWRDFAEWKENLPIDATAVPEPASAVVLLLGLASTARIQGARRSLTAE